MRGTGVQGTWAACAFTSVFSTRHVDSSGQGKGCQKSEEMGCQGTCRQGCGSVSLFWMWKDVIPGPLIM